MTLFFLGLFTGILSGMGVGGGTLLVPALVFFFQTPQQVAQGVILASFLPTAVAALYTHFKHGYIQMKLALFLSSGAFFGAIGGAWLANQMDGLLLRKGFGIFLLIMGAYECFAKTNKTQ